MKRVSKQMRTDLVNYYNTVNGSELLFDVTNVLKMKRIKKSPEEVCHSIRTLVNKTRPKTQKTTNENVYVVIEELTKNKINLSNVSINDLMNELKRRIK